MRQTNFNFSFLRQHNFIRAVPIVVACVVAGCTVGPNYRTPQEALPAAWTSNPTTHPSTTTTQPIAITQWWATFNDPVLNSLVNRAVQANLDIRQAKARVLEARARRLSAGAANYPSIEFNPSYQHTRISPNGVAGFAGGAAPSPNPQPGATGAGAIPGSAFSSEFDLYQAGFDANWEIDIFGGIRRNVEAATADLQASVESQRDVLLTVLGEVARNYIELRGAQRELEIAKKNLQSQREVLELTRDRAGKGLSPQIDVIRAQSQVSATAAEIPNLQTAISGSIDRLALLLAQAPETMPAELAQTTPIPAAPPRVPVGLPSDLLRRRPDIRRAERELAAATARIGVATADLFPRFSLTGAAGLQSLDASSLFDWNSRFYSIGPQIRWNVFNAGQVRANIDVQNARQQAALAAYQKSVLGALQEVHSALIAFGNEQDRREFLQSAVASDRQALSLAQQLYRQGLADFITVLDAQRTLFTSEDALARSDATVSADLVSLYKALGGGWEIENARRD